MFNGIKEITMTTVEIAAMTGKRHDNVLRDAHAIVAKVNALKSEECSNNDQSTGAIEATYLDGRKAERPMLVLNKHMVFTLITGYDTGLRYTVVGRWIELEQAANPAFASQAITETLIDLQTRVDAMAPAYDEHVRKGTTTGYTWREACRLAGVANPDKVMEMFIATGRAAKRKDLTRMHPKYAKSGWVREVSSSNKAIQLTGHLFKVTLKGINEWLRPNAENIAKGLIEHRKPRPVVDTDGYVIDIKGEGAASMTIADLPKGIRQ